MTSDRILIFRNQGIGDLMLISPAIRALRSLHPDAEISIFVGDWSRAAVEGNPHIDRIISYPDPWIQHKKPFRILQLINRIRKGNFRRAYIFHSHNMLHLLVKLAGIPERYGFTFNGSGKFLTRKTAWEPNSPRYIADNYLDIPRLAGFQGDDVALDLYLSDKDEKTAQSILQQYDLAEHNYIVIAPGGGLNPRQNVFEKRWGEDKFTELIRLLKDKNIGDSFILAGAPGESGICRKIETETSASVINLCGKTSFKVSAALVKQAKLLVGNDSSIIHTAVAFNIPSMAIFGPSNPHSLLPESKINRWISSGIDCSPCYCNEIFRGCDRDLACMKELSPRIVLSAIEDLLS